MDALLTETLAVRVTKETRDAFMEKAKQHGTPTRVHRELIEAFTENRLHIDPPALYTKENEDAPGK